MDHGLHLPLMDFGGNPLTLNHLIAYAETGQQLGFSALAANDDPVFFRPWLDGPTALATILEHSERMDLATTASMPIVRGPSTRLRTDAVCPSHQTTHIPLRLARRPELG